MISQRTRQTLKMLGQLIAITRQERMISQAALAERLHVSRQTVMAIEQGKQKVSIGTVFEAAHLLGIPLFTEDSRELSGRQSILNEFSALLPKRTRHKKPRVSDDF